MIPISKPWMGEEEAQAAARPLLNGWVTQGPEVAGFEKEFAAYCGAPLACAVSSGTTALHLALLAVGVKPGDEVVTVSHSFIATANSIRYCGATPVFADIDPLTFNMDPQSLERAITPRTRAVLAVHQIGMPCDPEIFAVARRHQLPVIEDAACAIGSEYLVEGRWERIGKPHGDIACFSFHPRKLVTTGDGGMITTANAEWDRQFRLWRQHGMGVPDTARHGAPQVIFESYPVLGYNYRMTDIQGAIGREQLRRLPAMLDRRREQVERYRALLAGLPGLRLPQEPAGLRSNWQSFCVALPEGCDQRAVMQSMLDAGVATRRGLQNAHREPAYATEPWSCAGRPCQCPLASCQALRQSEWAQDHCVILPLYHQLTAEEQGQVAAAFRQAVERTACVPS